MAIILKNPKQTANTQLVYLADGSQVVMKKEGTYFSSDEAMKKNVEALKKAGFVEVKKESKKDDSKK